MNSIVIMSMHSSLAKALIKYGSYDRTPQVNVARELAKHGNVYLFSVDNHVHALGGNIKHIPVSKTEYVFSLWSKLVSFIKNNDIDLVYGASGGATLFPMFMLNRYTSAKTVLDYTVLLHKAEVSPIKKRLYDKIEKRLLKYVDYVMPASTEIWEYLKKSSFNGEILPVGKSLLLPSEIKGVVRNAKRIIWVGRLEPIKHPLGMIESFKLVEDPDAELIMCGDGSLMGDCIKAGSDDNRIHILGYRGDIPWLMQRSSVYALTSQYDASPDSIIEAMALGLPTVSYDVGGVSDYVYDNQTGVLIPFGDSGGFADAIKYFLDNPKIARHMGEIAKAIAWDKHDLKKNIRRIIEVVCR